MQKHTSLSCICVIERTRVNTFFQTRGWVQGYFKQEVVEVQLRSDCKTSRGASKLGCCNGELSLWGHFLLVVWSIFSFLQKLCELVKIVATTFVSAITHSNSSIFSRTQNPIQP
jgi:hypothetical protein